MRKKLVFLRNIVIVLLAILLVLFVFDRLFGLTKSYQLKRSDFTSELLPEEFNGFKIAFISDLNIVDQIDIDRLNTIFEDLNDESVDMIIFGGDIYDSAIVEQEKTIESLKSIHSKYGKFAITGEKDQIDSTTCNHILTESGFEVLHNEIRTIYYQNSAIYFVGLENNGDCSQLLGESYTNSFVFASVHQPDYFDQVKQSHVELVLSGHTLGGYIKIPFYGGLNRRNMGEKYVSGTHKSNDSTLIISNGINKESDQNYRILTTDEINIITLKQK